MIVATQHLASSSHNRCGCVGGKPTRVMAGVEADHDAWMSDARCCEPCNDASRGLANHQRVHTIGPRPDFGS